ncbi:MAG TPA: helix-turn-helix domain-containing protein [Gaiellaceae bacterium]|nr:helix-turn-helix domain-containing protein [Gaiellaceae bacterium]
MSESKTTSGFGAWVTATRTARNLTLKELAARAEINARTLREIETEKRPNPSLATREKLQLALERADKASSDGGLGELETAPTASEAYGEWLLGERSKRNLTRQALAAKAGMNERTLGEVERGKRHGSPATRKKLELALGVSPPLAVQKVVKEETTIQGVGEFSDFDPHDLDELPNGPGVYVFYDISDRPVYVGESGNIRGRIRGSHLEKFWYRRPIVEKGSYVRVDNDRLRRQLEDTLIKFLKSNAVINRRQVAK